ncbi:MAG: NAD(P)/FAD-dependent oxidoreductase [Blastocatellia bacterium]
MNPRPRTKLAIIGGGMLGLTLAHELSREGVSVTVFEGAEQLGGLAGAWELETSAGERIVWDRHYHVTLLSDMALRKVLRDIGLEDDMQWVQTRTGFYTDGKLYSMSNTAEFLRFPPLNLLDKLRLGATIFYASRIRDWRALEGTLVSDWLRQLSGRRTFEKIWLPLLRAKLGENFRITSAAFIWATIARLYAARRTGLKREMFGYVPGGYARVLCRMEKHLVRQGVVILTDHRASLVESMPDQRVLVTFENGRSEIFDQAVVTAPAGVAARLCAGLTPGERERLTNVQYQGIICASLLLKKPLADFYVTNLTDSRVPFTGVIEMSALVDKCNFGGHALVYLPKYLPANSPDWNQTDEEIRTRAMTALGEMYPHFDPADVLAFRVSRVRQVFPIPTLHYSEQAPPLETSLPGVFLVNSAQILNGTLNVNETVQLAVNAARKIPLARTRTDAGNDPDGYEPPTIRHDEQMTNTTTEHETEKHSELVAGPG